MAYQRRFPRVASKIQALRIVIVVEAVEGESFFSLKGIGGE